MKKLFKTILNNYRTWRQNRIYKKKLAELKKRDPFIYKKYPPFSFTYIYILIRCIYESTKQFLSRTDSFGRI